MHRREFVGAVLALFAAEAMPEPVREALWVQDPWMPPGHLLVSEQVMQEAYMSSMLIHQAEMNRVWAAIVESVGDRRPFFKVVTPR